MLCKATALASCKAYLLPAIVDSNSLLESSNGTLSPQTWSIRLLHPSLLYYLPFMFIAAGSSTGEELQHLLLRPGLQIIVLQCTRDQSIFDASSLLVLDDCT